MYMISRLGTNSLIPLSKYSSIPGKLKKKSFSPVMNNAGATTMGAFGSWFGGSTLSNNDLQRLSNLRSAWKLKKMQKNHLSFYISVAF